MKRIRAKMTSGVVCLAACTCVLLVAGSVDYHLSKTIHFSGDGKWDYLAVDPVARRLYVSHDTQVEVIDVDGDKPIGTITGMSGVHGIAIAHDLGLGFIASGNTSTVKMFKLDTMESLADIPAGIGPDGLVFEPTTSRVFAFNHRGGTLTVIDAKAGKAIENIELGGQPEFPVTDGKGTVWVNLEDKSILLKIDAKSMKIRQRWPVAPCEEPASMAMDQKSRRLFIGCGNEKMAVADPDSGKIISLLPIGVHVDATAFDRETNLIFNANRGSVTIVSEQGPDQYSVVQTLETMPRANTLALDPKSHKLYLSSSTTKQGEPGPDGKVKQTIVPNSFVVSVYGQ